MRWFAGALVMAGVIGTVAGTAGTAEAATLKLSGTLLDTSGTPAAGATVTIAGFNGWSKNAKTDTAGHWQVSGVKRGGYKVEFLYGDRDTFARGKYSWDAGDVIKVTSKSVVVNDTIPGRITVSGVITDATTKAPLAGKCPTWFEVSDPLSPFGGDSCTGADGKYQLEITQPGRIVIEVDDETAGHAGAVGKPFTVKAAQQVTGKNLAMGPGGTVEGLVVDRATGTPLRNICPSASLGHSGAYVFGQSTSCSDAAGHWSIAALPGVGVTVDLENDSDQTHVPLWVGNVWTQKTATVLRVKPTATIAAKTVRLHHGAKLTGRITDTKGAPVKGAWVELGVSPTRCGVPCAYSSAKTGANGRYTMTDILPGKSIVSVTALGRGLAPTFSGRSTDPGTAKKLAFRADKSSTYSAVMPRQSRLKVTLKGIPKTVQEVDLDTFTLSGVRLGFGGAVVPPEATTTLPDLPAGRFRLEASYQDIFGVQHTIWYGGRTKAKARKIPLKVGRTTSVTFSVARG